MNIFGGRPGIAAGVLAVIAILAAAFLDLKWCILIFAVLLLFIAVCIVFLAFGIIKPYRFFSIAIVMLILITSFLRGLDVFYRASPAAEALSGENAYVHATISERYSSGDYYALFIIRLKSVNGVAYDGKALLICEYNSDLQVGYEFVLRSANVEYVMQLAENEALSFLADEIFLSITSFEEGDCHILSEGNYTFSDRLDKVNSYLCAKLRNTVRGDSGRLAAAMLLGDKSALTAVMYRDFSRAGISHYLAVSGLHVSIVTAIVSLFLVNLRVRRGIRNTLIISFALGYLLLLGFPVSAVRAVTMLTIVFIAYSLGDNSDTLNSLGIAAAMIVVLSPVSVFDKSFILSFCATLGIAAFLPVFNSLPRKFAESKKKDKEKKEKKQGARKFLLRGVRYVLTAVMTTLAAVSVTLLPSAFMFGETAVYALYSNLILAPVGVPMLTSSLLCLFLGKTPYLGDALVYTVEACSEYMLTVAAEISDIRGASVSLVSRGVLAVVIIFSVILFAAMIIKTKHKAWLLMIPAAYPLILCMIMQTAVADLPKTTELTCLSTEDGEGFVLQLHDETVLIDVSDGSYTGLNTLSSIAKQNGATEFDTLMLTHYHTSHISTLSRFISDQKVRRVLLPYPTTEDEAWIMVQLADTIQKAGVAVRVIGPEGEIQLTEEVRLTYPSITRIERSARPVLFLSFTDGRTIVTYLSASSWEDGISFESKLKELAENSDTVIVGAHGPKNREVFDVPLGKAERIYILGEEPGCLIVPESTLPINISVVGAEIVEIDFSDGE